MPYKLARLEWLERKIDALNEDLTRHLEHHATDQRRSVTLADFTAADLQRELDRRNGVI
jgi:hypothetical protein